jgi:leader peptidase (prepilin peptidase)/N-methyltransferase
MLPMSIIVIFLGFVLGMVVNVLADSLPLYRRIRGFHCQACGADKDLLAWSGVLALITGRRKCTQCGNVQDWRTALVEIVLAAGAYLLYQSDPTPSIFLPDLLILFIFLLIIVIDIEHRLILHMVSGTSALVILFLSFLDPSRDFLETLLGGAAGFFGFFILYLLGYLFTMLISRLRGSPIGEVAFGFGDVTLAGVIGLTVGWPGVVAALIIGIFLAGIFSFLFSLVRVLIRRYTPFMPIPYGPFMVIGCLSVYYGVAKTLTLMLTG